MAWILSPIANIGSFQPVPVQALHYFFKGARRTAWRIAGQLDEIPVDVGIVTGCPVALIQAQQGTEAIVQVGWLPLKAVIE